jgi:hypothetical protein
MAPFIRRWLAHPTAVHPANARSPFGITTPFVVCGSQDVDVWQTPDAITKRP